jgi:hypothetical protein
MAGAGCRPIFEFQYAQERGSMIPGGLVECFSEVIVRDVATDRAHFFRQRMSHGVSHETDRITQCFFGFFEPDDVACDRKESRL